MIVQSKAFLDKPKEIQKFGAIRKSFGVCVPLCCALYGAVSLSHEEENLCAALSPCP